MEKIVPYNSVIAILDRVLKKANLKPVYNNQEYINTITKEKEYGLILETVEAFSLTIPKEHKLSLGILGFVNGEEPGDGSIPLNEIFPKENDKLALAYILQGIYKGDFKEHIDKNDVVGLFPIIPEHIVTAEDLQEKDYTISTPLTLSE